MHLRMADCHIPFLGHCNLDLISRIIMSRTFGVWMHFEMVECHVPFLGLCDLTQLKISFFRIWLCCISNERE